MKRIWLDSVYMSSKTERIKGRVFLIIRIPAQVDAFLKARDGVMSLQNSTTTGVAGIHQKAFTIKAAGKYPHHERLQFGCCYNSLPA
jgi:hypothetical protein